ncbi:uncharacterized protein [Oscarella lobularis]|uniref:uncharacterized protein n=1 Tax=Oscarella lobularis TaxID=121494 RepID=UPI00331309FC
MFVSLVGKCECDGDISAQWVESVRYDERGEEGRQKKGDKKSERENIKMHIPLKRKKRNTLNKVFKLISVLDSYVVRYVRSRVACTPRVSPHMLPRLLFGRSLSEKDEEIAYLKKRIAQLEGELSEEKIKNTETHRTLRGLEKEVDELRSLTRKDNEINDLKLAVLKEEVKGINAVLLEMENEELKLAAQKAEKLMMNKEKILIQNEIISMKTKQISDLEDTTKSKDNQFAMLKKELLKAKGTLTSCGVLEFFLDQIRAQGKLGSEVSYSSIARQVPHLATTLCHIAHSHNWALTLNSIVASCQQKK